VSDVLSCGSPTEWESWLTAHWQRPTGVWLKIAKKGPRVASVTTSEALDVALCFGWIDGTRRRLDETHFLQWYAPRRPKSSWSKVNIARVEALVVAGRMRPTGPGAGRGRQGGRPVGCGVRVTAQRNRPARSRGGARP